MLSAPPLMGHERWKVLAGPDFSTLLFAKTLWVSPLHFHFYSRRLSKGSLRFALLAGLNSFLPLPHGSLERFYVFWRVGFVPNPEEVVHVSESPTCFLRPGEIHTHDYLVRSHRGSAAPLTLKRLVWVIYCLRSVWLEQIYLSSRRAFIFDPFPFFWCIHIFVWGSGEHFWMYLHEIRQNEFAL